MNETQLAVWAMLLIHISLFTVATVKLIFAVKNKFVDIKEKHMKRNDVQNLLIQYTHQNIYNKIDSHEFVQVLAELNELQQDKRIIEVMQLSAAGMPISAMDYGRVQRCHKLMHKLSELSGQTLEELFDKGGLQRIMETYTKNTKDVPF